MNQMTFRQSAAQASDPNDTATFAAILGEDRSIYDAAVERVLRAHPAGPRTSVGFAVLTIRTLHVVETCVGCGRPFDVSAFMRGVPAGRAPFGRASLTADTLELSFYRTDRDRDREFTRARALMLELMAQSGRLGDHLFALSARSG